MFKNAVGVLFHIFGYNIMSLFEATSNIYSVVIHHKLIQAAIMTYFTYFKSRLEL